MALIEETCSDSDILAHLKASAVGTAQGRSRACAIVANIATEACAERLEKVRGHFSINQTQTLYVISRLALALNPPVGLRIVFFMMITMAV